MEPIKIYLPVARTIDLSALSAPSAEIPKDGMILTTPEGILAYAEAKLDEVDRSIQKFATRQRQDAAYMDKINSLKARIDGTHKEPMTGAEFRTYVKDLESLRAAIRDPQVETQLDEALKQAHDYGDEKVGHGDAPVIKACLDGIASHITSDSSLQMIELQSLVSKRGQIINLTTNLLAAVNEASKPVINNIRV